jgi:hypothetical protein
MFDKDSLGSDNSASLPNQDHGRNRSMKDRETLWPSTRLSGRERKEAEGCKKVEGR